MVCARPPEKARLMLSSGLGCVNMVFVLFCVGGFVCRVVTIRVKRVSGGDLEFSGLYVPLSVSVVSKQHFFQQNHDDPVFSFLLLVLNCLCA